MRLIDYTDYCAFYTAYVAPQNISIVSCAECNEDGCNTHQFTEEGLLISDSGCSQVTLTWTVLGLVVISWVALDQVEL